MTAMANASLLRSARVLLAAVALCCAPVVVQAQARTAAWVNLRAGPAPDYPLVAVFPPGVPISVQGCIGGYAWCDVIGPAGERGWIYAGYLLYPYQSVDVPLIQYGPVIGIPIVTFVIGSYWGSYYRYRPWYGSMDRWNYHHRPPAYRPPPPRSPGWRPPPPPPRPAVVMPPPNRPHPPPVMVQPPPPRPRVVPQDAGPRSPVERPGVRRGDARP